MPPQVRPGATEATEAAPELLLLEAAPELLEELLAKLLPAGVTWIEKAGRPVVVAPLLAVTL